MTSGAGWLPTASHLRACIVGAGLVVAAIVTNRLDLLALGVPLAMIAVWSVVTRPTKVPELTVPSRLPFVREGQTLHFRVTLSHVPGARQAAFVVGRPTMCELQPVSGGVLVVIPPGDDQPVSLSVAIRSLRWGKRPAGRGLVAMSSSWDAFRWGPQATVPLTLTTLPVPAVFDAHAPTPHPLGLVGLYRSARQGDGSEFATIRPFHVGDRLRRINWPVSLRSRELHVTATYADQDAHVVLVVDASSDVGSSQGIDGAASSLDTTVRAAGAIAEHYLRHGDRVGLRVFGAASSVRVPAGSGRRHLRVLLERLASVTPGTSRDGHERATRGLGAGTLVVMLSACVSSTPLQQAVVLARRGLTVIVVDTLPQSLAETSDPDMALAWRIRKLERAMEMRRVTAAGVPIVPWHGPGSLDQVLRDLQRRAAAPHRVAR